MDLNTKISDLERANRKLETVVNSWRRDYDNQQKIIRDLKAALARKNQEFDELLGIKITLQAEIEQYRKARGGTTGTAIVEKEGTKLERAASGATTAIGG